MVFGIDGPGLCRGIVLVMFWYCIGVVLGVHRSGVGSVLALHWHYIGIVLHCIALPAYLYSLVLTDCPANDAGKIILIPTISSGNFLA